jgi:hypothetical protein
MASSASLARSLSFAGIALGLVLGCSSEGSPGNSTGGAPSTGGSVGTGGNTTGGVNGTGGQNPTTGGSPSTGGVSNTGGIATTGGIVSTGGANTTGGSPTTGGSSQTGGAGSGGSTTGGKNASGGSSTGGSVSTGGASTGGSGGASAHFSFFMASQAGLTRLSGNAKGFGGDLRFGKADGLSGADEICRQLAETSLPNNGKTWRAFLSVTKGPAGSAVNAIDRVGEGPWYDRKGRILAMNKAALLQTRPQGADAAIANDLPNEDGVPNHDPGSGIIDNHNVLTGSTTMGTLDSQGLTATCQDWTSPMSNGGRPRCGVSWPRASLTHWISVLNEGGCAPGTTPGGGAQSGEQGTVGALGGYGGFYCFALTP